MEDTNFLEMEKYLRNLTNINDQVDLDDLEELIYSNGDEDSVDGSMLYRESERNLFEFVTVGILLTIVSVFGLFGNVISIIVLSKPVMKGSFASLLIGLTCFDLLYLTISLFIFGFPAISAWYADNVYAYILPVFYGLGHIGRVGSVFVTTSVTIERYFAIVYPLKHFSYKNYLLKISVVLAVIYNIPKFYENERRINPVTNATEVRGSHLRSNPVYVTYYIFWSKFIFVEVIPYFTIFALNYLIIRKIWKSTQFRRRFQTTPSEGILLRSQSERGRTDINVLVLSKEDTACPNMNNGYSEPSDPEMTARQKREANLGIVLISISVLFIMCQSVKIIPDVYEVFSCRLKFSDVVKVCPTTWLMDSLIDISHLLLAINSSANFIIYAWRGEKFREVMKDTFGLSFINSRHNSNLTTFICRMSPTSGTEDVRFDITQCNEHLNNKREEL